MTFDGTINLPTILTIITLCVGVVLWMARLESKVHANTKHGTELEKKLDSVHALATLSRNELSEYKTHIAEVYVTKAGMSEQTDRIMKGLAEVGTRMETRVDSLGARLDRFYEAQPAPRSRRNNTGS